MPKCKRPTEREKISTFQNSRISAMTFASPYWKLFLFGPSFLFVKVRADQHGHVLCYREPGVPARINFPLWVIVWWPFPGRCDQSPHSNNRYFLLALPRKDTFCKDHARIFHCVFFMAYIRQINCPYNEPDTCVREFLNTTACKKRILDNIHSLDLYRRIVQSKKDDATYEQTKPCLSSRPQFGTCQAGL